MAMTSQQPSSREGDTLFRAMEDMLRRYAQRLEAGQSSWDGEGHAQGPDGSLSRYDAIAAAYQLAGYIAATTDPAVAPDPGAAAALLMIMIEFLDPHAANLDSGSRSALETMVEALRQSGA
jgi:hypothetical protein